MKRNNTVVLVSLMALLAFMISACSSDKTGDVKELLKTIPSDASVVAVMDIEQTLKEFGCKVKDGAVTPGEAFAAKIREQKNEDIKFMADLVMDGGVEPSCCAIFAEGYNIYITGFISDTDRFKNKVGERSGEAFVTEDNVATSGNIACTSSRFWICLSSRNSIQAKDIKFFQNLSEKQSYLSGEASKYLIESDNCMRGWGDIKGCLNALGLDFTTKAAYQMALEALFADAVEFKWDLDIEKDELEMDLTLLNSKGGIAAFLYPTSKINIKEMKESNLGGAAIAALAISPKFTSRMQKDTKGKGMSVVGMLSNMISEVDGTVLIASGKNSKLSGVIPVKGNNTGELTSLLTQYDMKVTREKGSLYFNNGETDGSLKAAEAADMFKDCMGGVVITPENWIPDSEGYIALLLKPEKGGMELIIKAKGLF